MKRRRRGVWQVTANMSRTNPVAAKAKAQLLLPDSFLTGRNKVKGWSTDEALKHLRMSCLISSLVSGGTSEVGVSSRLGAESSSNSFLRSGVKVSRARREKRASRLKTPAVSQYGAISEL